MGFHSELVNFDPIWCWPKPVQAGGPPVWMGSLSPKYLERVVDYCNGWFFVETPIEALQSRLRTLRETASRVGRKFETIELAIALFAPNEDKCKRLIELGFTHLVLAQPSEPRDKVLKRLDEAASIAAKI